MVPRESDYRVIDEPSSTVTTPEPVLVTEPEPMPQPAPLPEPEQAATPAAEPVMVRPDVEPTDAADWTDTRARR